MKKDTNNTIASKINSLKFSGRTEIKLTNAVTMERNLRNAGLIQEKQGFVGMTPAQSEFCLR